MADLTTLAAVRAQLGHAVSDTVDDSLIQTYVTQASNLFEAEVLRQTNATFVAQNGTLLLDARAPHAYGRKLYFRQPATGVYLVVNGDGQTLTSADYRLLPANDTPKYGMELKSGSGFVWSHTDSPQEAITIGGTLGYVNAGAIPGDVALAVTKAAAYLYMTRDNRGEVIRFADGSSQTPGAIPDLFGRVIQRYATVRLYV